MKLQWLIVATMFWMTTGSVSYADDENGQQADVQVNTEAIEIGVQQAQELAESLNLPEGFAEGAQQKDVFYQMMKKIIGQPLADVTLYTDHPDINAGAGTGNVTVMTWLISIMAGVGLVATALAGVFFLAVGLVRSNISGSFAGRNEGGAGWYFGRIGLASALNMPLASAGGLAISQVIMLVILLMGIGAGSAVFREASSRMLTQPLITYSHENIEKLYISALRARMCMVYAVEHGFIDANKARWYEGNSGDASWGTVGDAFLDNLDNWFTAETDSLEVKYYNYGPTGECGNIALNIPRQSETSIVESAIVNVFGGIIIANALSEGNGDNIETFIQGNMTTATYNAILGLHADSALTEAIYEAVRQPASPGTPPKVDKLIPAILSSYYNFSNTISYSLKQTTKSFYCYQDNGGLEGSGYRNGCKYNAELIKNISELGFAVAGSYTWILAERQTQLIDAINEATSNEIAVDFEERLEDWDVDASDVATQSAILMYRSADMALKGIASMKSGTLSDSLNRSYKLSTTDGAITEGAGNILKNTWRGIIKGGNSITGDWENPEPLIMMRAIGNTMLNVPIILGAIDIAASFTPPGRMSKLAGKAGGAIKGAWSNVDKRKNKSFTEKTIGNSGGYFLELVLATLFFVGFFLAVVVPAIPMVMWNTAIAGYFLYAIMVLVGTPIMVAAKTMDANSEGLVGAAKTGYYMAFNLFLRPTLMVAGLVIAMAVSRVLSWFWNAIFFETFQMTQSGTGSIASIIGYPMIWGIGTMVIIYKSYGLINDLAATVMKMFGAEGEHSMFNEEQDKDRLIAVMSQTSTTMKPKLNGSKPDSAPNNEGEKTDKDKHAPFKKRQ